MKKMLLKSGKLWDFPPNFLVVNPRKSQVVYIRVGNTTRVLIFFVLLIRVRIHLEIMIEYRPLVEAELRKF
jgi:hypothetical protein